MITDPNTKVLMVCRQASDFLLPGYQTGHHCKFCKREVQVSPRGQGLLKTAIITCNPCGFRAYKICEKVGMVGGMIVTKEAEETLERIMREGPLR